MNNERNLIGYGKKDLKVKWPNNARLALQIVLNYEEGGENCVLYGDKNSETFLSEIIGAQPVHNDRNMNMESIYEYGSRRGFWRLYKDFTRKKNTINYFWSGISFKTKFRSLFCYKGSELSK